jgi:glycerate kinase
MRVLVAPDKLKGSLTAHEAARAIAQGVMLAAPGAEVDRCPLADGGDGTLAVLASALGAEVRTAIVRDAIGRKREAAWGWIASSRTAIVESALAVGIAALDPAERDPIGATSFGVGELLLAALDAAPERILLGLGGSATTDGGLGMLRALGARAQEGPLERLAGIDRSTLDGRLAHTRIVALVDVDSPLTGPEGAALRFGPQKGASESVARRLDLGLARLASLVPEVDPRTPGAGAAGGLGFAVLAFLGGRLLRGADFVLDAVGADARARSAALVLTAEGRLDAPSLGGKVVGRLAARSRAPVVVLAGSVALGASEIVQAGLAGAYSICPGPSSEHEAFARAPELLRDLAARVVHTWLSARAGA